MFQKQAMHIFTEMAFTIVATWFGFRVHVLLDTYAGDIFASYK
jgi:hypothetical protein